MPGASAGRPFAGVDALAVAVGDSVPGISLVQEVNVLGVYSQLCVRCTSFRCAGSLL